MIGREDIIVRLRKAYSVLQDDGRFILADTVHVANCEIQAFRKGIAEVIALCDQDAVDQDHNATLTSWGRNSRAYAIGRGTACKGIAHRLRALLPVDKV